LDGLDYVAGGGPFPAAAHGDQPQRVQLARGNAAGGQKAASGEKGTTAPLLFVIVLNNIFLKLHPYLFHVRDDFRQIVYYL
jgi:hypothetical protein